MQMVAASKMRRAQEKMSQSRPYSRVYTTLLIILLPSHSEFHHPFMEEREVKETCWASL